MFESLSQRFEALFKRLSGQGRITERNIEDALREVRLALLEADVNLTVVREFVEHVRRQALGQKVLQSLTPEQHLIKFVYEELRQAMGGEARKLELKFKPPVKILLVGLQGSGKTTSAAKLARWLKVEMQRHPMLASLDVHRPAAIEQLAVLGAQLGVAVLAASEREAPLEIASRALVHAQMRGHDAVVFDSAGRLQIDEELMDELARLKALIQPHYIVLVADAMTGQEAANVARGFHERLSLSGLILTKLDSDARGGAALSIRHTTGAPILFAATGEKLEAFEVFHPDRLAARVLGMGDILTLIERTQRSYDQAQAKQLERKLRKDQFTLEDFAAQIKTIEKMGSLGEVLGMIPGFKKIAAQAESSDAQRELGRMRAMIDSMTLQERRNHALLDASRRARIANGAGVSVQELNRFIKQFEQTRKAMKKLAKMGGGRGLPRGLSLGG